MDGRRHLFSNAARALAYLFAALAAAIVIYSLRCSAPAVIEPAPTLETSAARPNLAISQSVGKGSPSPVTVTSPPPLAIPKRERGGCLRPTASARGGWSRPKSPEWTHEDRAATRRIIDRIAREMGANLAARRLLLRIADRESVGTKPWQIHVHPGDVAAASSDKARAYVAEKLGREYGPEWSYGRGLYGMQPWLYLGRWDASEELDALCDPVISTVIAVWTMRRQSWRCQRDEYQPTVEVANRAWGGGNCAERPLRDARERAWWNSHDSGGWDFDGIAYWGKAWPESSDRAEVLAKMREVAHADKG